VHLDLKPSSVFVDDKARLKIGDFGCVRAKTHARVITHVQRTHAPTRRRLAQARTLA
jgi:serine/threonine protein kinase